MRFHDSTQSKNSAAIPAESTSRWPLHYVALALGFISIVFALGIGILSYNFSFRAIERYYYNFYHEKAEMIVDLIEMNDDITDAKNLDRLVQFWDRSETKPPDEYICVIDKDSRLIAHTANPSTIGNYAGDNRILDTEQHASGTLKGLVQDQQDYVGSYISSAGEEQLAAFIPVGMKQWMLGVHRSKSLLDEEIASSLSILLYAFMLVCGGLMPLSFFLLYFTFDQSRKKRLHIQHALRESEESYRTLIESSPDVIIRFDKKGRHLFVSRSSESFSGIPAENIIGKTHRELGFTEEQYLFREEKIGYVHETGQPLETEYDIYINEENKVVNWRLYPEFDETEKVKSVLSITRDITALRVSERDYKVLFTQMLDGFANHEMIFDDNGIPVDYRFLSINPAFEKLTGLKADDVVGKTVLEVLPNTEQEFIEKYGNVVLTGEPIR